MIPAGMVCPRTGMFPTHGGVLGLGQLGRRGCEIRTRNLDETCVPGRGFWRPGLTDCLSLLRGRECGFEDPGEVLPGFVWALRCGSRVFETRILEFVEVLRFPESLTCNSSLGDYLRPMGTRVRFIFSLPDATAACSTAPHQATKGEEKDARHNTKIRKTR